MINNALRLVLIAANALLFVLVAYLFSTKTAGSTDFWFGIGLFIYFGLHFGYLLMNPPGGEPRDVQLANFPTGWPLA